MLVKRVVAPLPLEETRVCIPDHHPVYVSWDKFLENCAKIAENRPRWHMRENRGAIREGLALLVGLLRCGQCGGRVRVGYKKASALYYCDGGHEKGSRPFDPQRLVEHDWMSSELEAYVDYAKSAKPAKDDEPVLVPGDPERQSREERAEGIPVDAESWEQILEAGETLGVDRAELV